MAQEKEEEDFKVLEWDKDKVKVKDKVKDKDKA